MLDELQHDMLRKKGNVFLYSGTQLRGSKSELFDCRCGDKKLSEGETELRYIVNIYLADCTSWVWATMFSASSLFIMTSEELHNLSIVREQLVKLSFVYNFFL